MSTLHTSRPSKLTPHGITNKAMGADAIVATTFGVWSILSNALQVYRERQMLASLDDHMLKDIGIGRGDAYGECSRGFFDLPDRQR